MNPRTLLSKAFSIFKEPQDQDTLKQTDNRLTELEAIQNLADSDGGKMLIKSLVDDFFSALDNLIKTREDRYISDLKSIMDMINKLSVNRELESLRSYLEDRIKYAEEN